MLEQKSESQKIAQWIENLSFQEIPDSVSKAVVKTAIDTVGLSISARHETYVQSALRGWDADGPCTALGHFRSFDACGAAFINGLAAHGEDFDNTFEGCPVHSGAVIVPAIFSIAERYSLSGQDSLKAIAVGIEIMCRLGLVAKKSVHSAGFHPTSVLGTMACAAACSSALRLDNSQTMNALGIAASMAGGIIEYLSDGSSTKRFHAGWAAQNGIRAALLAKNGFDGPRTVFEGTHGLFASFASSMTNPDFDLLTGHLGTQWVASDVAFKPYACGTMTQPYIDCMIALRERGLDLNKIKSIECEVGEGTVHRLWEPLALKQKPTTPYGAKFSTPFCIAVAAVEGDAGLIQFQEDRLRNPSVLKVASKVSYVIDSNNEYPTNYTGHIKVTLEDGNVLEARQPCLRGGIREPMSFEEIIKKYHANLVFGKADKGAAERLLEFLLDLKNHKNLSELRALSTFK